MCQLYSQCRYWNWIYCISNFVLIFRLPRWGIYLNASGCNCEEDRYREREAILDDGLVSERSLVVVRIPGKSSRTS